MTALPPGAADQDGRLPEASAPPGGGPALRHGSGAAAVRSGGPASAGAARSESARGDAAAEQARSARLLNVANVLTVLRLVLVPFFIWFLLAGGTSDRAIAFVAFAVASVTDFLDGELARRRGLITDFGKIADPIADKALTGSALVTLSYLGELSWWVTAIIVGRELLVTGLRFWVIRHGVIPASRGGKAKTTLQIVAISLYVLPWHVTLLREIFMAAALVVTVPTGADYVVRALRLRRAVQ